MNKKVLSLAIFSVILTGCTIKPLVKIETQPANVGDLSGINDRNAPKSDKVVDGQVPGDNAYWHNGFGTSVVAPDGLSRSSITASEVGKWARSSAVDEGRLAEIRTAAAGLGAQAGLADRINKIRESLLKNASRYDEVYDFSKLMIEPGLLPPVITEARNTYNQENDDEARASDRTFRIEKPARIVSAPPTWRTYLLADDVSAIAPSASVMPKGNQEKIIWDEFAQNGWDEGVAQAEAMFKTNLARLNQDFQGMLRFKSLYEQGLVTMPKMARQNLGTTGGGNEMSLGDRTITITSKALLDANERNWSTKGRLPATSHLDNQK